MTRIDFRSALQEETSMRWGFLDAMADPCAVVTARMEIVYLNDSCQTLVPIDWFSKRCFEVLPTDQELCAMECPTILAVQTSETISYCEESLELDDGSVARLGTAVIPLHHPSDDAARAVLLFRPKQSSLDETIFRDVLLSDAQTLSSRIEHVT